MLQWNDGVATNVLLPRYNPAGNVTDPKDNLSLLVLLNLAFHRGSTRLVKRSNKVIEHFGAP